MPKMNTYNVCKLNNKEMKELLKTHSDNKHLKRWIKRQTDGMKEDKADGYSPEFERFWKAFYYTKNTNKREAYSIWNKVDDSLYMKIIKAAGMQANDVRKYEKTPCHPTTWLNQGRWESFDTEPKTKPKKSEPTKLINIISLEDRIEMKKKYEREHNGV